MERPVRRAVEAAIDRIESARWLDRPGYAFGNALARLVQLAGRRSHRPRNILHGTGYGHPVHPALVTIPIGAWTLAVVLDVLGALGLTRGSQLDRTADIALKAGSVGAAAAAVAGINDWQYTDGGQRRLGIAHGLTNATALGLMLISLSLRRRDRRGEARLASTAGWLCLFAGGYLGGHLVYRLRVGVDHADRNPEPRDFRPVLPLSDLPEDRPCRVVFRDENAAHEVGVVLVRRDSCISAIGARCSHMGGPLDQGWILENSIVCPWHGSRYDLDTGEPVSGPSTSPQPRYQVRVRDGFVEIRREQDPGDHVVTSDSLAKLVAEAGEPPQEAAPSGKDGVEVLVEHHGLIRRLFERIAAISAEDPQRRDLLRVLASELEIHEYVEDKLFYPAVWPVSEDVPIAHAEHRQLADLLAMTLKLGTATAEFHEHFAALHAAFEHHASSEERSMFPQSRRLGEARMRSIGQGLETMLEDQRTSRFRRAFRDLKISLLEQL